MRKIAVLGSISILAGALSVTGLSADSATGFSPATDYAVRDAPVSVAVGDLNGDLNRDLATANLYVGTFSVLLGRGDGTFGPKRTYRAGGDAGAVAIRDLNGDRKPDLVVDGGAFSVLLSRPGLCNVQDLRRQTLLEAKRTLARVNCRVGKVSYAYSRTIRDRVIGQKPKLGAVLRGGSPVDVVLSRGGKPQ